MNRENAPSPAGRRAAIALLAGIGAAAVLPAQAQVSLDASERLLPTTGDVRASLAAALQRQQPLIVLATLHGCPFCKIARENYLVPAVKEGAVVVQIHFLSTAAVVDWHGQRTTHGQLVRDLRIEAAPTLLFYGRDAQEVVPRLVAGSASDFYGAYLDERIAQARAVVRG